MDILLVNAPVKNVSSHAGLNPPLGLAYIASVLRRARYRVAALDFNLTGFSPQLLENSLRREQPHIIGISTHTETYVSGLAIAALAKRLCPEAKVVIGGPHASIMYEEAAREPQVDVVAIGEGEYTMLELAEYYVKHLGRLARIKGIAYREEGHVRVTPPRPFIQDPDELPFPSRDLFPMPLYSTPGQVLASRGGCPFNCHFCAVNNIWQGGRHFRRPQQVLQEVEHIWQSFGLEEVSFADDAFTLNRRLVLELCRLAQALPFPWRWRCATRVDLVDAELLQQMRAAGCYSVTYGVEAGSQEVLDAIGKKITLAQVREGVRLAQAAGIEVVCAFMFPHPYDTPATVRRQIAFMKELKEMGATLSLASTTPFPGTYYYDHREELGLTVLASGWDEYDAKHLMITTRHLPLPELKALLREMVAELGLVSEDEGFC